MTTKFLSAALAAGLLGATFLSPAQAADLPSTRVAPLAPAITAWNPWQLRVRATYVVPNDGSKVYAAGTYLGPTAKTNISNTLIPSIDITYYFTPNIAAELILGTTPHNARGAGAIAGLGKLGSVWLLPPTLTLQYHFTGLGAFKPYVGAGVNYTIFYSEKDSSLTRFRVKDSFGWALQVGFDYMIDRNWGINVDVKKLFLKPSATGIGAVGTPIAGVPIKAKLDLDPWIISAGVTYKF